MAVFSLGYKDRTAAIKAAFCIGGVSLARKLYKGKRPSLDGGKELANTCSKSEHVTVKKCAKTAKGATK